MKTKLIFSTETLDTEQWTDLPFVPRMHEWFNVNDILKPDEVENIKQSANCWSGVRGTVESVEYKHDANEFYSEIFIWCED
jgi:uncharacterized protein YqcC (DUF446 family)